MRLAGTYVRSLLKDPMFYLSVAGCAVIMAWGMVGQQLSWGWSFDKIGRMLASSGLDNAFDIMCNLSAFRKMFMAAACIPFTMIFGREIRSGYYKAIVVRSGRKKYVLTHGSMCFFTTAITAFIGMLFCMLIMSQFFPVMRNDAAGNYTEGLIRWSASPDSCWLYFISKALVLSVSFGAWSLAGMILSVFSPDPFIAVCSPLVVSYILEFLTFDNKILPDLYNAALCNINEPAPLTAILKCLLIYFCAAGVLAAVFCFAADRRLKE